MVTPEQFIDTVERIKHTYSVVYKNGSSGQKVNGQWLCDCRGLILWDLRILGLSVSSSGTNWMIRNQMTEVHKVSKASELVPGQVVFKSRTSTSLLPTKYKKGGSAYDSRFGELDVYHIGVVVQVSPSLIIIHCTSGGIKTDTALGAWNWAGWVKWVSETATPEDTSTRESEKSGSARVVAPSGNTVNLRKEASKSSVVLIKVPVGSEVTVVSDSDAAWYKVTYGSKTGYMMAQFVERG